MGSDVKNCPKCGAAEHNTHRDQGVMRTRYRCMSAAYEDGSFDQSASCHVGQIAQLQQQLAGARLLARAATKTVWWCSQEGVILLPLEVGFSEHPCTFDPDGLPILTDELRAKLKGAVGE